MLNLSSATTSEYPTGHTEGPSSPRRILFTGHFPEEASHRERNKRHQTATLQPPQPSNRRAGLTSRAAGPSPPKAGLPKGGQQAIFRGSCARPAWWRQPGNVELGAALRGLGHPVRAAQGRPRRLQPKELGWNHRLPGFPRCQSSFSNRPPNKRGRASGWAARGAGKRCTRAVGPFPRPPAALPPTAGPGLARPRHSPSIFSARGRKRERERRRADGRPALAGGGDMRPPREPLPHAPGLP